MRNEHPSNGINRSALPHELQQSASPFESNSKIDLGECVTALTQNYLQNEELAISSLFETCAKIRILAFARVDASAGGDRIQFAHDQVLFNPNQNAMKATPKRASYSLRDYVILPIGVRFVDVRSTLVQNSCSKSDESFQNFLDSIDSIRNLPRNQKLLIKIMEILIHEHPDLDLTDLMIDNPSYLDIDLNSFMTLCLEKIQNSTSS